VVGESISPYTREKVFRIRSLQIRTLCPLSRTAAEMKTRKTRYVGDVLIYFNDVGLWG
jgi:hypothetical protein